MAKKNDNVEIVSEAMEEDNINLNEPEGVPFVPETGDSPAVESGVILRDNTVSPENYGAESEMEKIVDEENVDEIISAESVEDDAGEVTAPESQYQNFFSTTTSLQIRSKIVQLLSGAQYNKKVLTGRLSGVERRTGRVIALVTYTLVSPQTHKLIESVTIKIAANEMGLPDKYIDDYINRLRSRAGRKFTAHESGYLRRYAQRAILESMLHARVDFIIKDIITDDKTGNIYGIAGSRIEAMQARRNQILRTYTNPLVSNYSVGRVYQARIVRVSDNYLAAELSGFERILSPQEVTPLAISLPETYSVGDNLPVILKSVSENTIYFVGADTNRYDIHRLVGEYRYGNQICAQVYRMNERTGTCFLRMPNGCTGICYYDNSIFRFNPHVGDYVNVMVTGTNKSHTVVKCRMRKIV